MRGGVDIVQIRERTLAGRRAPRRCSQQAREVTRRLGVPLVVNDRPDLAPARRGRLRPRRPGRPAGRGGAQPSASASASRRTPPQELDATEADYAGVGPVYATPTKEGRPAAGLDYVRYAAAQRARALVRDRRHRRDERRRRRRRRRDAGSPSSARSATRRPRARRGRAPPGSAARAAPLPCRGRVRRPIPGSSIGRASGC